jgi:hypothetical protein
LTIKERVRVNFAPTPMIGEILLNMNFENKNYECFLVKLVTYNHVTMYVDD